MKHTYIAIAALMGMATTAMAQDVLVVKSGSETTELQLSKEPTMTIGEKITVTDGTTTKEYATTERVVLTSLDNGGAEEKGEIMIKTPSAGAHDCSSPFFTQFSESYVLEKGKTIEFRFTNYNKGAGNNWCNWLLVAANNDHRGETGYREYFVLRNDNYGWDSNGGNTYNNSLNYTYTLTNTFNWDTFVKDMNGAKVDMLLTLNNSGNIEMNATITTTANKAYTYKFTCDIKATDPVTVFFTVENSYIVGDETTGVMVPVEEQLQSDGMIYNASGQRVGPGYKGVVIRDGRKYFVK